MVIGLTEDKYKKLVLPYELLMISLAVTVAVLVLRELIVPLTEEQIRLYRTIDYIILILFAGDYFVRLYLTKNRKAFIKNHIPELIAIIPFDNIFRMARLVRLVRLVRLLRAMVILRRFSGTFFGILRTNGLQYVLAATVSVILAGAVGIYYLERHSEQINTFGDALWWAVITSTTVGYGDIAPITIGGRLVAIVLMVVGVAFIGVLTATIATFFISQISG